MKRSFIIIEQVKANWHKASPDQKKYAIETLRKDKNKKVRQFAEELAKR